MRDTVLAQALEIPTLDIIEPFDDWIKDTFRPALRILWDVISSVVEALVGWAEVLLTTLPEIPMIIVLAALAWLAGRWTLALFTAVAFSFVAAVGFFEATMESLALVIVAAFFAVLFGIPVGILASRSRGVSATLRPILDFMQTMPAFVYLLIALIFFGIGFTPGVVASFIFSMPPAVRLTELGIRQVDAEVVEAARAFGAADREVLLQVQMPLARPTIMAGVNQVIMLALSMIVIAGLAGAGGVAADIVAGVTRLEAGRGLLAGVSVVVLAIYLDRVTASFGTKDGPVTKAGTA